MSDDKLLEVARIGDAVQRELASSVALRTILARAAQEKEDALKEFGLINPTDYEKMREIQACVWRADSMARWINIAIQRGQSAEKTILGDEE